MKHADKTRTGRTDTFVAGQQRDDWEKEREKRRARARALRDKNRARSTSLKVT